MLASVEPLPVIVLKDYRKKRPYLSSMLSKNEVSATGRSRQLFTRRGHGLYTFNPSLSVRVEEPGGEGR